MVDNVQPLTVLDSLVWVDLSYNNLKNINELVYSKSMKMTINVAFNYIGDFSLFGLNTRCNFILEGTTFQIMENAPILTFVSCIVMRLLPYCNSY